jgi:hypothetical protein
MVANGECSANAHRATICTGAYRCGSSFTPESADVLLLLLLMLVLEVMVPSVLLLLLVVLVVGLGVPGRAAYCPNSAKVKKLCRNEFCAGAACVGECHIPVCKGICERQQSNEATGSLVKVLTY